MWNPPAFPKIPAYQGQADALHAVRRVVCMEKLDGTNARIGASPEHERAEQVRVGGRTLMSDAPRFAQPEVVRVAERHPGLREALIQLARAHDAPLTVYGEVCGGRIQAMGYIYGGRPHLVLFAARLGDAWLSPTQPLAARPGGRVLPSLVQVAEALGVPVAPVLYEGPPDAATFEALVDRPSAHSRAQGFARDDVDTTHEGVVVWADPLLCDPWGAPLVAKHKHPNRREYRSADAFADAAPEAADTARAFALRAVNAERLRHAIEHIRASGRWGGSVSKNRAAVVRRVIQDVAREVPEYQTCLAAFGKKATRAALSAQAEDVWRELEPPLG